MNTNTNKQASRQAQKTLQAAQAQTKNTKSQWNSLQAQAEAYKQRAFYEAEKALSAVRMFWTVRDTHEACKISNTLLFVQPCNSEAMQAQAQARNSLQAAQAASRQAKKEAEQRAQEAHEAYVKQTQGKATEAEAEQKQQKADSANARFLEALQHEAEAEQRAQEAEEAARILWNNDDFEQFAHMMKQRAQAAQAEAVAAEAEAAEAEQVYNDCLVSEYHYMEVYQQLIEQVTAEEAAEAAEAEAVAAEAEANADKQRKRKNTKKACKQRAQEAEEAAQVKQQHEEAMKKQLARKIQKEQAEARKNQRLRTYIITFTSGKVKVTEKRAFINDVYKQYKNIQHVKQAILNNDDITEVCRRITSNIINRGISGKQRNSAQVSKAYNPIFFQLALASWKDYNKEELFQRACFGYAEAEAEARKNNLDIIEFTELVYKLAQKNVNAGIWEKRSAKARKTVYIEEYQAEAAQASKNQDVTLVNVSAQLNKAMKNKADFASDVLQAYLATLTDRQRQAIVYKAQGLSVREICAKMRIKSSGTAQQHINEAQKKALKFEQLLTKEQRASVQNALLSNEAEQRARIHVIPLQVLELEYHVKQCMQCAAQAEAKQDMFEAFYISQDEAEQAEAIAKVLNTKQAKEQAKKALQAAQDIRALYINSLPKAKDKH